MARERLAGKAAAEEKDRKQSKTILSLLKYFNRRTNYSSPPATPGDQQKHRHDGQSTSPTVKTSAASTETVELCVEATDARTGAAPTAAAEAAAACSTGFSSLSSKPTTAVVIATASSRRINLCRTTLGLQVTSMPSTYEEDLKRGFAAAEREGKERAAAEDEGGAAAGEVQAAVIPEKTEGQEKKKLKKTEEPQFSDAELLLLLGDSSHGEVTLESSNGSRGIPRTGRDTKPALGIQMMQTKLHALRMAVGKGSSIAQQLWNEQQHAQQHPAQQGSKSPLSNEGANSTTSGGQNSSSGGEEEGQLPAGSVVISADTIIELDGKILEKAENRQEAKQMLLSMSGKTHSVHTAICIFTLKGGSRKPAAAAVCTTHVTFVDLTEDDVDAYVETGEYEGKSGSYGIMELAGQFVKSLDGCVFTVMGLPVQWVSATLANLYYSNRIA